MTAGDLQSVCYFGFCCLCSGRCALSGSQEPSCPRFNSHTLAIQTHSGGGKTYTNISFFLCSVSTEGFISLLCSQCACFTWHHTTPTSSAAFQTSDSAAGRKFSCKEEEPRARTFLYRSEQLLFLLLLPLHKFTSTYLCSRP